jgi:hypothetical protein
MRQGMQRLGGIARLPWRPLSSPTRIPVDQRLSETLPRVNPPPTVESTSGSPGSLPRRYVWAVLLAIVIAAVSVIVLPRSAGPASLDRELHLSGGAGLPPVLVDAPTEQTFTALADGLSGVVVRFGTYRGATKCSITAAVSDSTGALVSRRTFPCKDLVDGELRRVNRFRPLSHSAGKRFRLRVTAHAGARQAVALWGVKPAPGLPPAISGHKVQPESAELLTEYGKRRPVLALLGTAVRRMAQYRPVWARPPIVVLTLLLLPVLLVSLVAAPPRYRVVILLGFCLLKGLLWSITLPPLEGPDEGAHYAYAQFMAEDRAIPRRGASHAGLGPYSPELDRANRLLHRDSPAPGNRPDFGPGTRGADEGRFTSGISRHSGGSGPAAGYSPAYYAPAALLYRAAPGPTYVRIATMRLWSVALGLLSVWLALLIGRRLFPESEGAALALALGVALQPMFSQQTAIINNDALVIAGGCLCLFVAMKLAEPEASRWLPLLGGLALGAALLGKPFGLALAPVVAFGWLVGWLRTTPRTWKAWPVALARFGLGVASTYGLWVAAAVLFGYPPTSLSDLPSAPGSRSLHDYVHVMKLDNYQALKLDWVDRFWGYFAWLDLPLPRWVYSSLRWATLLVIVLVAMWLMHVVAAAAIRLRRGRAREPLRASVVPTLVCLLAIASTLGLLHFIEFQGFVRTARADIIQGRYGLMVLPAVVALPALLLRRLVPRLPVVVSMVTVTSAIAVLHVLSLARIIDRFYL